MTIDQDEVLGYDADHTDPSQYCKHGTWIGSWWGPDYMCHACELGVTDKEYILGSVHNNIARQRALINKIVPMVCFDPDWQATLPQEIRHRIVCWLTAHVLDHYEELAGRQQDIDECEAYLLELGDAPEDDPFWAVTLKAWRG